MTSLGREVEESRPYRLRWVTLDHVSSRATSRPDGRLVPGPRPRLVEVTTGTWVGRVRSTTEVVLTRSTTVNVLLLLIYGIKRSLGLIYTGPNRILTTLSCQTEKGLVEPNIFRKELLVFSPPRVPVCFPSDRRLPPSHPGSPRPPLSLSDLDVGVPDTCSPRCLIVVEKVEPGVDGRGSGQWVCRGVRGVCGV